MNRTPTAILNAAALDALGRLEHINLHDIEGYEAVLCAVSTEYGMAYAELETEVQDRIAERDDCDADEADEEAMYGSDAPMHDGPARLHDDDYYARNDAGEYSWM
jgi:hypothetical protein